MLAKPKPLRYSGFPPIAIPTAAPPRSSHHSSSTKSFVDRLFIIFHDPPIGGHCSSPAWQNPNPLMARTTRDHYLQGCSRIHRNNRDRLVFQVTVRKPRSGQRLLERFI